LLGIEGQPDRFAIDRVETENLPPPWDTLQLVGSEIGEQQFRSRGEMCDRVGHQDLTRRGDRFDPLCRGHGDTADLLARELDFADVETRSDVQAELPHREHDREGTPHTRCRARELSEEAIAGRIHLVSSVALQLPANLCVVPCL
jgi:hypothetical protein